MRIGIDRMHVFEIKNGDSPIVLSIPHTGEHIPGKIFSRLSKHGRAMIDMDWHVHRLYDGLLPGATVVRALFHRYVIDANRDPAGKILYSDRMVTPLCPAETFEGLPIYKPRCEPDEEEIRQRTKDYHIPYHTAIEESLRRAYLKYGIAILYDCHSIRSRIARLFKSKLPDLNIGTYNGESCTTGIQQIVHDICDSASGYSVVLNGRFKGGWTTRHYGKPETGIHAIQMELSQSTYMLEYPPWTMNDGKAESLRQLLASILTALEEFALSQSKQTAIFD